MRSLLILLLAFSPFFSLSQGKEDFKINRVWSCTIKKDYENWEKEGCEEMKVHGQFEIFTGSFPRARVVVTNDSNTDTYTIIDERESDMGTMLVTKPNKGGKWDKWKFVISKEREEIMAIHPGDFYLIFDVTKEE